MAMQRSTFEFNTGRPVVHFQQYEFNQLGVDHGLSAVWWRTNMCPCRGAKSDQPNLDCTRCTGLGWYWINPLPLTMVSLSDSSKRIFELFGDHSPGDLMVTFPTEDVDCTRILAGRMDRLYFPTRIERGYERKRKGDLRANLDTAERIYSPAVSRVMDCVTVEDDFIWDTDFVLTPDPLGLGSVISWQAGQNAPDEGEYYTIGYESSPFYFVRDVKYRGEADVRMPQALRVQKVDSPTWLMKFGEVVSAPGVD